MALPELLANSPVPGELKELTKLNEAMNASQTTVPLEAALPTALQGPGQVRLVINHEIILCEASSSATLTVIERGAESSTAASHTIHSPVYHLLTAAGLEQRYVTQGTAQAITAAKQLTSLRFKPASKSTGEETLNNYSLPANTLIYLTTTGQTQFSGFTVEGAAPQEGWVAVLQNVGENEAVLLNENAGSSAANRLLLAADENVILSANGGSYTLMYNAIKERWVTHSEAAPVPFTWFDVRTFGALGNGEHDDTAAIKRALAKATAVGGATVFFPQGTYMISETINVEGSGREELGFGQGGIHLVGASMYGSIIKGITGTLITGPMFKWILAAPIEPDWMGIEALHFNANSRFTEALLFEHNTGLDVKDVLLRGATKTFMKFSSVEGCIIQNVAIIDNRAENAGAAGVTYGSSGGIVFANITHILHAKQNVAQLTASAASTNILIQNYRIQGAAGSTGALGAISAGSPVLIQNLTVEGFNVPYEDATKKVKIFAAESELGKVTYSTTTGAAGEVEWPLKANTKVEPLQTLQTFEGKIEAAALTKIKELSFTPNEVKTKLFVGMTLKDAGGVIAVGATISAINEAATEITMSAAASGEHAKEAIEALGVPLRREGGQTVRMRGRLKVRTGQTVLAAGELGSIAAVASPHGEIRPSKEQQIVGRTPSKTANVLKLSAAGVLTSTEELPEGTEIFFDTVTYAL